METVTANYPHSIRCGCGYFAVSLMPVCADRCLNCIDLICFYKTDNILYNNSTGINIQLPKEVCT